MMVLYRSRDYQLVQVNNEDKYQIVMYIPSYS